jgi:hypothetical protein
MFEFALFHTPLPCVVWAISDRDINAPSGYNLSLSLMKRIHPSYSVVDNGNELK